MIFCRGFIIRRSGKAPGKLPCLVAWETVYQLARRAHNPDGEIAFPLGDPKISVPRLGTEGRAPVNGHFRVAGMPGLFAIGDAVGCGEPALTFLAGGAIFGTLFAVAGEGGIQAGDASGDGGAAGAGVRGDTVASAGVAGVWQLVYEPAKGPASIY